MNIKEKKIRELRKKVMMLQINGKYSQANRLIKRIDEMSKAGK